ncbi:BCCT family transporter [Eubacterium sp. 1001713B170207_170306_E7]|uniref:BCCT family transporter n=1 Tax=Eubacterium sp. 1001713B170207_170306_E7 TaxID=2787097 RepID=UPI00189A2373|nr:BCCT family transporter [Eubacterium sp. 1001713B170207_170306_E7]
MKYQKINLLVFVPAILLFGGCILLAFLDNAAFVSLTSALYAWILDKFGWLFLLTALVVFLVCIGLYFSPFGKITIGGKEAKPMMSTWNWFSITLCTTVASGIVFWGAAEPVQHILNPPVSSGIEAMTPEASLFAMAAVFRHWTVLPYGLYTILAVVFAFVYYNMCQPFSLGSVIAPLIPKRARSSVSQVVDFVCVFALVTGLAASLASGVLSINGGLNKLFGVDSNEAVWGIIILIIGGMTIIAAVTGITRGIKYLSNINVAMYIVILGFILLFGGITFIFSFGIESIGEFLTTFFSGTLFTGTAEGDPWAKNWTMFYLGNWMAWAPVTAVFLGRISYGRRVKDIIAMNLFVTALFSIVWFMIISGATVNQLMHNTGSGIVEAYNAGYENVIYQLFKNLPLSRIFIPLYLLAVLISFVTAADSTTMAIAGICSKGIAPDSPEPPASLTAVWGIIVAVVTWIMMSVGEGITGIKMLSNIGGLPAMILIIFVVISALMISLHPEKYNSIDNNHVIDRKHKTN